MAHQGSIRQDVQKSLQMLGDAIGTPTPLLHHTSYRTPMSRSTRTDFTPVRPMADLSSLMTPSLSQATPRSMSYSRQSFSMSRMKDMEDEDASITNIELLTCEDPGLQCASSLFPEFTNALLAKSADHQVFQLLEDYENLCHSKVAELKKLFYHVQSGEKKFAKVYNTMEDLKQERYTWRLLADLYRDRLESELQAGEEPMYLESSSGYVSDKKIIEMLYEKDASIRQSQLIVDWLERNASEELDSYYDRVEFFSDQSGAWENTLHTLQQKSRKPTDRPMVNEMDPDAPTRQKKPLADLDQEDDKRLLKFVFTCIRGGKMDEAQKVCIRSGQPWRSATLEGWKLYHDPNYTSAGSDLLPVEGNPHRDIWKLACLKMAEEESFSIYERAIYASLSGNLRSLLPACQSWADYLWAYTKVMIDTRMEQEVRINSNTLERATEGLPKNYWDKVMSMDSIFRDIQSCSNETVQVQSKQKFPLIQKYIILNDLDALVEEMYEWVKDYGQDLPAHLVRFMAHLVLFFRSIGVNTKEELCVTVLVAYVKQLIQDKETDLIATFVSKLPPELQVDWYAKFLEGVHGTEERQRCLTLGDEANLDVASITKLVVENIRQQDHGLFNMDTDVALDRAITEEDKQKIEAIEWLVFDPFQRAEAMRQANAVMRTFLASKKHTAARAVFDKIPSQSIEAVIRSREARTGSRDLPAEDANAIREYLCIEAYLDAQDAFNDWFEHYHNAKPVKPEMPPGASFTEKVAYEHREKQYMEELHRWEYALQLQSKLTEEKIYNVLLFVDGGWMIDQQQESSLVESRLQQMALLRQMCLPQLCFLLHKVLHATQDYKKCLQLADVIASEQHQLYSVFSKDDMEKLLQCLKESSVENLNKNLDPLGYTLS